MSYFFWTNTPAWASPRPAKRPPLREHDSDGILIALDLPTWMSEGLCAQTDPEEFFPEKGSSTRLAKAICMRCPVRAECLDHAIEHDERYGIWGGLSERERRELRRTRREAS